MTKQPRPRGNDRGTIGLHIQTCQRCGHVASSASFFGQIEAKIDHDQFAHYREPEAWR